jgi:hypothetical protein
MPSGQRHRHDGRAFAPATAPSTIAFKSNAVLAAPDPTEHPIAKTNGPVGNASDDMCGAVDDSNGFGSHVVQTKAIVSLRSPGHGRESSKG